MQYFKTIMACTFKFKTSKIILYVEIKNSVTQTILIPVTSSVRKGKQSVIVFPSAVFKVSVLIKIFTMNFFS